MKPLAPLALITLLRLYTILASPSNTAITCGDVIKSLRPCINHLRSGAAVPPASCCAGLKSLSDAASSTCDKKAACQCIKYAFQKMKTTDATANALPGSCGINLPFTLSSHAGDKVKLFGLSCASEDVKVSKKQSLANVC